MDALGRGKRPHLNLHTNDTYIKPLTLTVPYRMYLISYYALNPVMLSFLL